MNAIYHRLSTSMTNSKRNSFSLNLKTPEVATFLESDRLKADISKTAYLNDLLTVLSSLPAVLSAPDSPVLDEVKAFKQLLEDDVINKVPQYAVATRRHPVQMLLHLIEKGIAADEQLSSLTLREDKKVHVSRLSAKTQPELFGSPNYRTDTAA